MSTKRSTLHTIQTPAGRLHLFNHLGQIVRRAGPRRLELHENRVHDMPGISPTLRLTLSTLCCTRSVPHPNPPVTEGNTVATRGA